MVGGQVVRRLPAVVAASLLVPLSWVVPAPASATSTSCPTTKWEVDENAPRIAMNPRYSPHYINAGPSNNDHQKITFKTGYGWRVVRQNANCTTSKGIMANWTHYSLRNCDRNGAVWACTPWTGWNPITSRVSTCGAHAVNPRGFGCVYGHRSWVAFGLSRKTDSRT